MKKRISSIVLTLCMVLTLLPTAALAVIDDSLPLYYLDYLSGINSPTISGTDNAPVFTFPRDTSRGSAGVITSKYGMDFTRSFNIEGSVIFAERDGVSFALHTTPKKKAYTTNWSTCMLASYFQYQTWNKADTQFDNSNGKLPSGNNDMSHGLLWDFIQVSNSVKTSRINMGAYSYQINGLTDITALPDDSAKEASDGSDAKLGIQHYDTMNNSGAFALQWTCTNANSAVGNLTLTMGDNTSFTYTGLNAGDVFGSVQAAKNVYFSFSTALPNIWGGETTNKTEIAIDRAYYTDTDNDGVSTLGVETAYYIDTDGNGTYETQLKKATLVGADQTVLCRNKIYNKNKTATSEMDMTLLIPNLSSTAGSSHSKIGSISDEKFYTHAHGAAGETLENSKMSSQGAGPLNSNAPLTNYVKVTLPAGGNGTTAYEDAYAVYEYTFTPGAGVTALNQTIQLGVAPFTPAVLSSTVFFNSPEAFKPDNTAGKILFGTDDVGGNGLYRVVAKDNTSVTLFYNGADISGGGKAHSDASTWLNEVFLNTLTAQERDALLTYDTAPSALTGTDKIVLPSEEEVKDSGTWTFSAAARATAESGQPGTNWWLRTPGSDDTARAVTQNGTQIVDIATTQTNGIRPVMRLNLANVLFTKDSTVNLTNSPSDTLTPLSAVGSETAPFRLTLLDTSRDFAVDEDNATIDVSVGDVITFNYTGATAGDNCYVSALLTNSTGQDIYYGRLKAIATSADANGTAVVTIPSTGLGNGSYTLKLFSETIYAEKASDVGSSLQSMTLQLGNNLNGTVSVAGTAEYGCTLTATVTNSNYLGTLRYQWKRDGVVIGGATESSYTLTADDIGKAVTCEVTDSGDGSRDNSITSTAATVNKRTLTFQADNKTMTTGGTLPKFTLSITGFVNADTQSDIVSASGTAACATDGKTAGSYPITVSGSALKSDGNAPYYQIASVDGTLTVTSPSGGGSTPSVTVPVSSDTGSVKVSATISGGTASVTVSDSQLEAVIDSAKQTGTVVIDLSGAKNVDSAQIPVKLVKAAAESVSATGLQVELPTGAVVLDKIALACVNTAKDLTISVTNVKPSNLTAVQKETLGDKLDSAVVVDVNVLINGNKVTNFNGGRLTVSMPYTPKNGENTSKLTVWYIKDDGSIENVGGHYDTVNKCFVFTTTHLSQYILVSDITVTNSFTDVERNAYYYDAVLWAVKHGVTAGTSETTFSPDGICTRAQAVTFLWRAMGSPTPTTTKCPFADVKTDAYYYKAVLWAVEKGITVGTSATTFSPDTTVDRSQTVTLLWRAAGKPAQMAENPFGDVKSGTYYESAVLWAVSEKITEGTTATTFSPADGCTRGQIVTFLYRYFGK